MRIIYIGIMGLIGIYSRYFVTILLNRYADLSFMLSTHLINIIGSFLIGILYVVSVEKLHLSLDLRIAIMVGLLGGFTTFSAYSLEIVLLMERGQYLQATLSFLIGPIGGVVASILGMAITRKLL